MFYVVAVIAMWLVALGPEPEWSTPWRALTYGPYYLLVRIPGIQSIRVPARAWFPAMMCLSVLAAFGTVALLQRYRRQASTVLAGLALLIVVEGWCVDRIVEVPRPMRRGTIPEGATVLDLPIEEAFHNAVPQYRGVVGGYRTVNGYSGYLPPHFTPLRRAIGDVIPSALDEYRRDGDLYVIIRPGESSDIARWIARHPGAEHLFTVDDSLVYRLPRLTGALRPSP
jgi:hypothetical protein